MHYPLTHVAACMICRRIVWNIFVIETHVTFFGKLDPLFSLSLFEIKNGADIIISYQWHYLIKIKMYNKNVVNVGQI
jgi:hypothetical protein